MPTNESADSDSCSAPTPTPTTPTPNYTVSSTIRNSEVRTVMLYGVPIIALIMDGVERLCLAQISNTLLKSFSYNEIHNRRVALGITCIQCTPVQLELLRRAGAMPVSSRRCGMITKREAERLCKSFLAETAPPKLPENFAFDVYHHCSWGCKGNFMPSRYNSSRAKCIKCTYCGLFFSPNKFIFHSHQLPNSKYVQPDAANFNSWRRHIKLAGNPPEDVCLVWEDVKAMFNGGSRKRAMSCGLSSSSSSSGSGSGIGGDSGGGANVSGSTNHSHHHHHHPSSSNVISGSLSSSSPSSSSSSNVSSSLNRISSSSSSPSSSANPNLSHHNVTSVRQSSSSSSTSSTNSTPNQHYDKRQRLESPISSIESTPTPPHHLTPSHIHPHHPLHSLPPPTPPTSSSAHHHHHIHSHLSHHHNHHSNSLLDPSLIKGFTGSGVTAVNCSSLSSLSVKSSYPLSAPMLNGTSGPSSSSSSKLCAPITSSSSDGNNTPSTPSLPPPQSTLPHLSGGKYNGSNQHHLSPADFRPSFVDLMTWSSSAGGNNNSGPKGSSSSSSPNISSWNLPYGCVFWPRSSATAAVAAAAAAAAAVSTGSSASNRLPSDLLYPVMDAAAVAAAASSSSPSSSFSPTKSSSNSHHHPSLHSSLSDSGQHHHHHPAHHHPWLMPIEAAASSSFLLTSAAAAAAVSQSRSLIESASPFNGPCPLSHVSAFKPINNTNKPSSQLSSKHNNNNISVNPISSTSSTRKDDHRLSSSSPTNPLTETPDSPIMDDIDEPSSRPSPDPSDTEADVIDIIGNDEGDYDNNDYNNIDNEDEGAEEINDHSAASGADDDHDIATDVNNANSAKQNGVVIGEDTVRDDLLDDGGDLNPSRYPISIGNKKRNRNFSRFKKHYTDSSNETIKKESPSMMSKLTWTRQELIDKINQSHVVNNNKEINHHFHNHHQHDFDRGDVNGERTNKQQQSTGLTNISSNLALDLSNMGSLSKGDDLNRLMLNGSESRQRLEKELELMQNLVLNGPYNKCSPRSGYPLIGDDQGRSIEQSTRDEMHKRLQLVSLLKLNQLNYHSS